MQMQACLTGDSGDQQKHQEGWHSPYGWMLLLRGQLQRAASRGRAARPIIAPPRPVRRCVVMTGTWRWRRWRPASSSIGSSWYKFGNKFQCSQCGQQEEVWCEMKNTWYGVGLLHQFIIWQLSGSVTRNQLMTVLTWFEEDQQRQQEGELT